MKTVIKVLAFGLLGVLGATAQAANPPIATPYNPTFTSASGLGPVVVTDNFTNINSTAHPGYPGISGSQVWPAPIGSDAPSGSQAFFQKQAGASADTTDFLAASSGGGIYSFFSNTHFEISVGVPLTGVNSIRLELSIAEGGSSLDVIAPPTLTLQTTSGSFTLTPTTSALVGVTPVNITAFGSDTDINLEAYTWDVSAYVGTITSFTADWQVDQHSISYGGQIAQAAVPEPSSSLLIALCGTVGMLRIRHRLRKVS